VGFHRQHRLNRIFKANAEGDRLTNNFNANAPKVPYRLDMKAPADGDLDDLHEDRNFREGLGRGDRFVTQEIFDNMSPEQQGVAAVTYSIMVAGNFQQLLNNPGYYIQEANNRLSDMDANLAYAFTGLPGDEASYRIGPRNRRGLFDHKDEQRYNVFVPDENFDFQKIPAEMLGFYAGKVSPVPGTSQEWSALIGYHEMEHRQNIQSNLREFYQENHASLDLTKTDVTLMTEIEADCGAFNALDGLISQDVKDYWVAGRIFSAAPTHLENINRGDQNPDKAHDHQAVHTHDTGFHLAEFDMTGEVPDYFETQNNVREFYETLHERLSELVDGGDIDSLLKTNPEVVLGAAVELKNEGAFPPEQEQMAHHFITAGRDTLGIQPSPDWRAAVPQNYISTEYTANQTAEFSNNLADQMASDMSQKIETSAPGLS